MKDFMTYDDAELQRLYRSNNQENYDLIWEELKRRIANNDNFIIA